jgi:polysaccharide pyruvyl transferase WcaK-like protein
VSDIAFTLKPEPVDFELENYVVLNLSPLVIKRNPIVKVAYQALLDYVLKETDMSIALVPHVVQSVDNDYDALSSLDVSDTDRVKLVSDKFSATQYKTIISKAKFCVAARTHATIAAYSSCVPAIAVGYSVKAHGIARDLNIGEHVVDAMSITSGSELVAAFRMLMSNEKNITATLKKKMLQYIRNAIKEEAINEIKAF